MELDPQAIGPWVKLAGDALAALMKAKDALPKGKDRDQVEERIQQAETALGVAHAEAASRFMYDLCRCTFPPQIMLEEGNPPRPRCPKCGRVQGGSVHELAEDEVKILRLLAERPSDGCEAVEVAHRLGLAEAKADYFLNRLEKSKKIFRHLYMGRPSEYALMQGGREYLVEHGLL